MPINIGPLFFSSNTSNHLSSEIIMAVTLNLFSSTLLISLCLAISQTSLAEAESGGFSIQLIHPASRKSPFFDPASLSTELVPDPFGAYLINFSVGNPPRSQLAIADSGSHINWIQCKPCIQCYPQDLHIFNPRNSSSYKALPCNSANCIQNNCQASQCVYAASYFNNAYSFGDLATETFTFHSAQGEELSFPSIVFGCAYRSNLAINEPKVTGIIGLGISRVSLISQMSPAFGQKFSYCFVPLAQLDVPSTLSFGDKAWGIGTLFTPVIVKPKEVFYFLTLLGISVGDLRLELVVNSSTIFQEGNIAIDSGTTYTVLPTLFYNRFKTAFIEAIDVEPLVDNGQGLCYKDLNSTGVPLVTMHFIATDLCLSMDNLMLPRPGQAGIWCLAFVPTEDLPFLGNVAQTNFLVGYDLEKLIVSFKSMDCTKLAY